MRRVSAKSHNRVREAEHEKRHCTTAFMKQVFPKLTSPHGGATSSTGKGSCNRFMKRAAVVVFGSGGRAAVVVVGGGRAALVVVGTRVCAAVAVVSGGRADVVVVGGGDRAAVVVVGGGTAVGDMDFCV